MYSKRVREHIHSLGSSDKCLSLTLPCCYPEGRGEDNGRASEILTDSTLCVGIRNFGPQFSTVSDGNLSIIISALFSGWCQHECHKHSTILPVYGPSFATWPSGCTDGASVHSWLLSLYAIRRMAAHSVRKDSAASTHVIDAKKSGGLRYRECQLRVLSQKIVLRVDRQTACELD